MQGHTIKYSHTQIPGSIFKQKINSKILSRVHTMLRLYVFRRTTCIKFDAKKNTTVAVTSKTIYCPQVNKKTEQPLEIVTQQSFRESNQV